MTTFVANNRPAPLDMRGIDPHAIYREVKPAAVNHQAVKPAAPHAGPALLVINTKPQRPDEFAGYSVNAAIDEAIGAPSKPLASRQQAVNAGLGEFAGYSINDAINAAHGQ